MNHSYQFLFLAVLIACSFFNVRSNTFMEVEVKMGSENTLSVGEASSEKPLDGLSEQ